jgi:septum site-determining protein MinC
MVFPGCLRAALALFPESKELLDPMAFKSTTGAASPTPVFELKAATFTLPVIRLLGVDMDVVADQLAVKVDQAPDFFRNTPVVIDLSGLPRGSGQLEFPQLVGLMRGFGMIPVGIRGGTEEQHEAAQAMELAILGDAFVRRTPPARETASPAPARSAAASRPAPAEEAPTASQRLVTRPVRSGQRVYAAGGDLSVIAPVSNGAELMADGNIHVYGPLRGRAMAGMKGDTSARIFCQDLRAELISVAGHYRISENIPEDVKGVPVQIFLDQDVLRVEKI